MSNINVLLLDENGNGLIPYIPNASNSVAGLVKVGNNLSIDANGVLSAAGISGSAGSGTNPVYLNDGTLVASSSTVGGNAKPVYLSSGTITASTENLGNATTPIYMSGGQFYTCSKSIPDSYSLPTASTSQLGGVKVDGTSITINNGVISSNATISGTVGTSITPVYLNNGAITSCSRSIPNISVSGSTLSITY